jgi:hypothetical protein
MPIGDNEHFLGGVALVEQDLPGLDVALLHVGQQPVHREVAVCRRLQPAHQPHLLVEAIDIHRQQDAVLDQHRQDAGHQRKSDLHDAAGDAREPQRDHGAHGERHHHQSGADKAQNFDIFFIVLHGPPGDRVAPRTVIIE